MNTIKTAVHFVDNYLIAPTNPITINLIGAGGTGSKVLTALLEMNHSLIEFGHPGLFVTLWDDDTITTANLGRQKFARSEVGLLKSVAIINKANRNEGTNWKAQPSKFERDRFGNINEKAIANITITCVDNVKARFDVAEILKSSKKAFGNDRNRPLYWLDFGNSQHTGQVILATVGSIDQPESKKYETVASLPFITDEYGELLKQSEKEDDTPSCSLPDALAKQDLFINGSLAQMGCDLLWKLFRNGMTQSKGFFHNLKDYRTTPIKVA
ncbi:thiazole biosynthesis adenylyltransferase ThiF [Sphingobacterium faecium NBRC 15299]|uniref:PRTRC system ThiF family protein n=1 Tax=Sphingobacterium faecium TaxID=34087 RepID=UPI000D3431EC|nr:PRTRC system ThiF family protein [Sphingobacterium faecium]PTX09513.1 PRTRC genetic system ThiF family protein [Sphingobacterium faecium]GEM63866.1 thiazole biosynthesis adenylyltransferase ThiF [Sphingobacterium faecium NBRC 15299]